MMMSGTGPDRAGIFDFSLCAYWANENQNRTG
jgi:hypothetical protein